MTDFQKYIQRYIDLLPQESWQETALATAQETVLLCQNLSDDAALYSYSEGKWTIKEVLQHIMDTERIFMYRILAIARGEQQNLPGFDENSYVENSFANRRTVKDLLEEFQAIRKSLLLLVNSLENKVIENLGSANGNRISAETVAKLVIGHHIHHHNILKERYFKAWKTSSQY